MVKSMQDKQGFSLVEVMIAMVVVTFFAAGVYGTLILASKIYYSGRDVDEANLILQHEIENVRGERWETVEDWPELTANMRSESLAPYDGKYTLRREIDSSISGMKKITFTVGWEGQNGSLRELSSGGVAYTEEGLSDSYYREY